MCIKSNYDRRKSLADEARELAWIRYRQEQRKLSRIREAEGAIVLVCTAAAICFLFLLIRG